MFFLTSGAIKSGASQIDGPALTFVVFKDTLISK